MPIELGVHTHDNHIIPDCLPLVARWEGAVSNPEPGIPRVEGGGGVPCTAQAGTPRRTLVLFLFIRPLVLIKATKVFVNSASMTKYQQHQLLS
jgi:hypothetical protein